MARAQSLSIVSDTAKPLAPCDRAPESGPHIYKAPDFTRPPTVQAQTRGKRPSALPGLLDEVPRDELSPSLERRGDLAGRLAATQNNLLKRPRAWTVSMRPAD